VKLCLVSAFPDIVKDCPKMTNLPKILLRSFENVDPEIKQNFVSFLPTTGSTAVLFQTSAHPWNWNTETVSPCWKICGWGWNCFGVLFHDVRRALRTYKNTFCSMLLYIVSVIVSEYQLKVNLNAAGSVLRCNCL